MMAPVFSRAAWRCVWHMIQVCSRCLILPYISQYSPLHSSFLKHITFMNIVQNDLIHAWGLDKKLGYCAQVTFNHQNAVSSCINDIKT